jgi:hypothetical protein
LPFRKGKQSTGEWNLSSVYNSIFPCPVILGCPVENHTLPDVSVVKTTGKAFYNLLLKNSRSLKSRSFSSVFTVFSSLDKCPLRKL